MTLSIGDLYLYSYKNKSNCKKIQGALESLYSCLLILQETIKILSDGGTQEVGKEMIGILQKQLSFLGGEYKKIFPLYTEVCKNGAEKMTKIKSNVIFLKDLRYLFCELAVGYLQFANSFVI